MAIPGDVFILIGSYIFIVVAIIFFINRSSVGFLASWFKVKSSRGKKILVKVRTLVQDYYTPGEILEGWLVYRPRGKKKDEMKRLAVVSDSVYRAAGVNCIDTDDEKNCTVKRDFTLVSGYDAEKANSLYLRALYKPSIIDDQTKIMLVMLVVIIILVGVSIFMVFRMGKSLTAEIEALKTVGQTVSAIVPRGGAV